MIYGVLSSISRDYPPLKGTLSTCYWAVRRVHNDSRLACLNRIPIAVAAGRINRSQFPIIVIIRLLDGWKEWQFTIFHRCSVGRHTLSNDPSNGTFVASNVRIQESTPFSGDLDSPSFCSSHMTCAFPCNQGEYISFFIPESFSQKPRNLVSSLSHWVSRLGHIAQYPR